DINGDGFADLIIGAPNGDAARNEKALAGDSYVVFGKASGWGAAIDLTTIAAGTGGFVIHGQDGYDSSGVSVASAGDINGDGFADLIIGAPEGDAAGNAKNVAGDSYVVFGKATGWGAAIVLTTIAAGTGGFVIHGQDGGDFSGRSVASAGDINGDGFADLIIGANGGDAAGNAKGDAGDSYVVFGKASGWGAAIDLTTIAAGTGGFVIHGQDAGDNSGWSVASAGDINGDGFADLIIGAYGGDAARNEKGLAGDSYVVFGKASGWGAAIDLTTIAAGTGGFVIHGQDAGDNSGWSVASAGDINGDGFADLIIGARYGDAAGNLKSNAGDSYVVFGKASGWGAPIDLATIAAGTGGFVIHGQDGNDRSGSSVASAGDINGDGFADLIIG
ncbi:MAG: integrin alpha, partial [Acetobacteraceae bacterium]|nr:integrin alpha [Acetobacteraceae bacterium]